MIVRRYIESENFRECEILNEDIYHNISNRLGWIFILFIILLYLASMISSAYSAVYIKWLTDIKYITITKMLIYFGIIGFVYSFLIYVIFSYTSCDMNNDFLASIIFEI